jgi:molybdate transport system ATP-binding protein
MPIDVHIEKVLHDKHRRFNLCVEFNTTDDFLVLFGHSGAGKSLTLQSIAGLIQPDRGHVRVNGKILFDSELHINMPAHQRKVGYLPQHYALFPHLNVLENISFGLTNWQWRISPAQRTAITEIMEIFEIHHLAKSLPKDLSGGQQQRVALARALVCQPNLLLLDEPFAALNPLLRGKMRAELLRIQLHFQLPMVIITHDQADVETFGNTVIVLKNGEAQQSFPFKNLPPEQKNWILENLS